MIDCLKVGGKMLVVVFIIRVLILLVLDNKKIKIINFHVIIKLTALIILTIH